MTPQNPPRDTLTFPTQEQAFLTPHLPPQNQNDDEQTNPNKPFTTLTFATSLDSSLAISAGARTVLSGPQSKAMTHYLRSRHDAIMIGVGTAVVDNPGLNCRLEGVGGYGGRGLQGQPRPVILDPSARWDFLKAAAAAAGGGGGGGGGGAKILELVREGRGRAPYIVTGSDNRMTAEVEVRRRVLEELGGKYIFLDVRTTESGSRKFDWNALLGSIGREGIGSVMVEGGGAVINSLLEEEKEEEEGSSSQSLIDSVVVTIAPTWLGRGGVVVSPRRRFDGGGNAIPASRLTNVTWHQLGEDVVLCGKVKS